MTQQGQLDTKLSTQLQRHSSWLQVFKMQNIQSLFRDIKISIMALHLKKEYHLSTVLTIFGLLSPLMLIKEGVLKSSLILTSYSNSLVQDLYTPAVLFKNTLKDLYSINKENLISEYGPYGHKRMKFSFIRKDT